MQLFLMQKNSTKREILLPQSFKQEQAAESVEFSALRSSMEKTTLGVSQAQKLMTGQTFASVRQITEACHAIQKTDFTPITPEPEWYAELNRKFSAVTGFANTWIRNYAPAVTSTIPSSIINFAATFASSFRAIKGTLDGGTGDLKESELATIRKAFERMLTKTTAISNNISQYCRIEGGKSTGLLVDWAENMRSAGIELKTGTVNVQTAATALATQIGEFNEEIKTLDAAIAEYQKNVSIGAGLVSGGIFIGIIGGILCFTFPPIGISVLVVGTAALIGGGATWGVFQKRIRDANRRILDFNRRIKANTANITTLGILSSSMDTAVRNADIAQKKMGDFLTDWLIFSESLRQTIINIDEGKMKSQRFEIGMPLDEAMEHWEDVKGYARDLTAVSTAVETVPASEAA